jgi:nitroreductase
MNDIIETIFKRRSVRSYQPKAVEKDKLLLLLQAAMAAPNACNSQPWEFIVVTDPEILKQLHDGLYSGKYDAPAAIIVCGNLKKANNSASRFYWVQDCAAAAENILIAAAGIGLGAVWIGVYPLPSVIKPVSAIMNLPEDVIPMCVIYIGYPAEDKAPRTQYDERRVYWQQYEPRKKPAKIKNAKYLK